MMPISTGTQRRAAAIFVGLVMIDILMKAGTGRDHRRASGEMISSRRSRSW